MTDREKMIEEIACKIERIFIEESRKEENKMYPWQELPVFRSICLRIATSILPDGSVVLTKEEYERLKKEELYAQGKYNLCHGNRSLEAIAKTTEQTGQILIDYARRIRKAYDEIIPKLLEENKRIRKETARDIIKDLIGHRFAHYEVDEKHGTYRLLSDYVVDKEDVKFFEDKYGVEVEE